MRQFIHRIKVLAKRVLLPLRLMSLLPANAPIKLVQIGSNDGMKGDPFHLLIKRRLAWRALLVEPIPYLFEQLQRNYGDESRLGFENVAVGTELGVRSIYFVSPQ